MGQIQDLEQRITDAFARISTGVEAVVAAAEAAAAVVPPPVVDDGALVAAQMALDEERMAHAQLAERLKLVQVQGAATETALRAQVEVLTRQVDAQGLDVQRLSGTVAQLREDLRRLREAAEQSVVDPTLINKTMMAELEALRATRAAEVGEMNDILAALGGVLDAEEARAHA